MSCDGGCGCAGAGGCGYGGAGSYGSAVAPYALGAPPAHAVAPGTYLPAPINVHQPGNAGGTGPAPTAAPAASTGIGTILLAIAAVATIGGVAWWSYRQNYQHRSMASASTYRPRSRRPARLARR